MKVGGNAAFADFLARHPGSFSASSGNVKDRYTCPAALKYRDELARRSAADLAQFGPGRIVTSDLTGGPGAEAPVANGNGVAAGGDSADADFFDSWNKPAAAPKPRSTGAASPLIALSPSGSRAGSRAASPAPSPAAAPAPAVAAAPAQPRTTTSASLRATAGTTAAGPSLGTSATRPMKLGASRIGSGAGTAGGARSKLGAAKASAPIDFDAAERKAREEEERIKQLGYDSRREAEEAAAKAQANAQTSAANAAAAAAARKAANAEVEKAALGVQRLGFGQVTGMSGAESAAKVEAARKAAARAAAGYDNTGAWRRDGTKLTGQTRRARRSRATSSASRRASRRISTLAATPTTRTRRAKPSLVFSNSPARPPSLPIRCVTHQRG